MSKSRLSLPRLYFHLPPVKWLFLFRYSLVWLSKCRRGEEEETEGWLRSYLLTLSGGQVTCTVGRGGVPRTRYDQGTRLRVSTIVKRRLCTKDPLVIKPLSFSTYFMEQVERKNPGTDLRQDKELHWFATFFSYTVPILMSLSILLKIFRSGWVLSRGTRLLWHTRDVPCLSCCGSPKPQVNLSLVCGKISKQLTKDVIDDSFVLLRSVRGLLYVRLVWLDDRQETCSVRERTAGSNKNNEKNLLTGREGTGDPLEKE